MYDFVCQDCGERFEALVRNGSTAACPSCKSERLQQLISSFAMSSDATRKGNVAKAHKQNEKLQNTHLEHRNRKPGKLEYGGTYEQKKPSRHYHHIDCIPYSYRQIDPASCGPIINENS